MHLLLLIPTYFCTISGYIHNFHLNFTLFLLSLICHLICAYLDLLSHHFDTYLSLILLLLFCSFGCSSSSFLFLFYSPTHSLLSPETYSWPLFRGDQVSISLFSIARFLNCVFCLIFFIIVAQTRTLH